MANMGKTSKRQIAIRLDLHLCRAVEKKFHRKDDESEVVAYIRAIEDATRDVLLTANDYKIIAKQIQENENKRNAHK